MPTSTQRKVTNKIIKPVVPVIPTSSARVTAMPTDSQRDEQATTKMKLNTPDAPSVSEDSTKTTPPKDQASEDLQASKPATPPEASDLDTEVFLNTVAKVADKKQRPGKLDIAAAKDASKADPTDTGCETSSALDLSQPPTPVTGASHASVARPRQPRTIRLSREDIPLASPSILPSAATSRQASRRPSPTSANRPDTPASEKISDNASFTTTSISRANSPPPSRLGSAPVRTVTKSQQKKERQQRAKLAESAAKVEEAPAKAEEVQAPILGRKKKAKKEKTQGTAESTPTVTRPTSPVPKEEAMKAKSIPEPSTPVQESKKTNSKIFPEAKDLDTPSSPATPAGAGQQRSSVTAAAIFASLLKAGEISASAADLFKPVQGINHRFEPIEQNYVCVDDIMSEDQALLLENGELVHVNNGPTDHIIVFPDRRMLRGFTAEQAARYLELRKKPLWNGEIPSHKALDDLVPYPPSFDPSKGATKERKLHNPFAAPIANQEPVGSNTTKYGSAIPDGALGGGVVHRQATMSVAEAEQALAASRKETEILEKKLNAVIKKNRRLLLGNGH